MKGAVFLFVIAATLLFSEAKHVKTEKPDKTPATADTDKPVHVGFRVPAFAIRLPFFGGFPFMGANIASRAKELKKKMALDGKFDDEKMPNLKTKTKTSNSTHGPFKTYTVTTETVNEKNKSNPQVYEKVIKSITTLDNKNSTGNVTLPKITSTQFIFSPFGSGMAGMQDNDSENVKLQDCSPKKPCPTGPEEMYCDAFFGVCKKKVIPGEPCTQKDQCKSNYLCTWGRCVRNADGEGSAGTFCDQDSECHGASADEELGCFKQPDISRFAKVCSPKLSEGATCGRFGIFDVFQQDDELSSRCRKDLVCKAVGFFGRKACIREAVASPAPEETKAHDIEKKHHHRHHHHH
ncbi:uncharacterized protein LOC116618849 [Nematostella vectensis]|uniref:uncharacterized protein LOC116618849 n=1 Tax=Nematostella vectensis TaxID=45351 RepID=UPI0020779B18|nr:uncharacterized protein LOC116618849 [Nematostella vectensis]